MYSIYFCRFELLRVWQHVRRHQLHGHPRIQAVSGKRNANTTAIVTHWNMFPIHLCLVVFGISRGHCQPPLIINNNYYYFIRVHAELSNWRQLLLLPEGVHGHWLLGAWVENVWKVALTYRNFKVYVVPTYSTSTVLVLWKTFTAKAVTTNQSIKKATLNLINTVEIAFLTINLYWMFQSFSFYCALMFN